MGTVEYVGKTINPKNRFYQHTKAKPNKNLSRGRFYI
jgi:predicted GIY-YIG superfamily endonuclease